MNEGIRLPNSKQRITIVGRTGSGKTVAALWHLSNSNFDVRPWVVIDFKTDENINSIPRANYIGLNENPKRPGIYIVQPHPEDDALGNFLDRIWQRENTGVYVDEGYMMSENAKTEKRFKTLLTQGRSKRIPMIVLTQRPAWISRFVFSEADFFQLFHLNDTRDIKTVDSFLPTGSLIRMPDFHSVYFDVSANRVTYLSPVPPEDEILEKIDDRLRPVRKVI
jgi:hypothetical protein